jgi:predicted acylesterase/phospholipase RssA
LALSGGGVRATLFSLGVVIGLIETGCHRNLRCVTSVSGGSILNAALAHGPSLNRLTLKSFYPMASRLSARLASRGAFAFDLPSLGAAIWYLASVLLRTVPALLFGLLFALQALRDQMQFSWEQIPWDRVPWSIVGWCVLVGLVLAFWFARGEFQEAKYASVISDAAGKAGRTTTTLNVSEWGEISPSDPEAPGVMHVLVATDLLCGEPMYFSSKFVYCRPYGWGLPNDVGTATAVYSSAAFPAVFPPKRLTLKKLNFQNGEMPGSLPGKARLVDGGVYNNLGTDWFDVLKEHSGNPNLLWAFGERDVDRLSIEPRNIIAVNASAPSRRVRKLGPLTLARIMSVLYDNTVRPRVELIRRNDQPIIDIAESPRELAELLYEQEKDEDTRQRARNVAAVLGGKTDDFWRDFRSETAGTKTKLSKAGPREAVRLMLHGYLSSLVLLHAKFDAKLPDKIRGEQYFLSLVGEEPVPPPVAKTPEKEPVDATAVAGAGAASSSLEPFSSLETPTEAVLKDRGESVV